MNLEYFPQFLFSNFPIVKGELDDENIRVIGEEFKSYLLEKFTGDTEKLTEIWDIDPKTVIMNQVTKNPFTVNGYHPALVIHFTYFVEENTPL